MEYNLDFLIKTFSDHSQKVEKEPDYMDQFNLPKALLTICQKLKEHEKSLDILDHETTRF